MTRLAATLLLLALLLGACSTPPECPSSMEVREVRGNEHSGEVNTSSKLLPENQPWSYRYLEKVVMSVPGTWNVMQEDYEVDFLIGEAFNTDTVVANVRTVLSKACPQSVVK